MSEQNVAIVRSAYEAFGRGDLDALIGTMVENVEWSSPGPSDLATAGHRRGHAEVREFFRAINELYEFLSFEPKTFIAQGDHVVVLGVDTVRVKASGNVVSSEWAHASTLKNGKITNFTEYIDTSAIVAELRGAQAKA